MRRNFPRTRYLAYRISADVSVPSLIFRSLEKTRRLSRLRASSCAALALALSFVNFIREMIVLDTDINTYMYTYSMNVSTVECNLALRVAYLLGISQTLCRGVHLSARPSSRSLLSLVPLRLPVSLSLFAPFSPWPFSHEQLLSRLSSSLPSPLLSGTLSLFRSLESPFRHKHRVLPAFSYRCQRTALYRSARPIVHHSRACTRTRVAACARAHTHIHIHTAHVYARFATRYPADLVHGKMVQLCWSRRECRFDPPRQARFHAISLHHRCPAARSIDYSDLLVDLGSLQLGANTLCRCDLVRNAARASRDVAGASPCRRSSWTSCSILEPSPVS